MYRAMYILDAKSEGLSLKLPHALGLGLRNARHAALLHRPRSRHAAMLPESLCQTAQDPKP